MKAVALKEPSLLEKALVALLLFLIINCFFIQFFLPKQTEEERQKSIENTVTTLERLE